MRLTMQFKDIDYSNLPDGKSKFKEILGDFDWSSGNYTIKGEAAWNRPSFIEPVYSGWKSNATDFR